MEKEKKDVKKDIKKDVNKSVKKEKIIDNTNDKENDVKKAKTTTKKSAEVKEDIKTNVNFNLLEVVIIILITGIVVSITTGLIVYNNYDKLNSNTVVTKDSSELSDFVEHYNKIVNSYVEEVNKDELLEAAIAGMYNYLGDDYSMYLSSDDTTTLEEQLGGEYTGLGVEITTYYGETENKTVITKVFKDSPAEKGGLKVGDILIKLDEMALNDKDSSYVSNYIKYGDKSSFVIVIEREEKEIEINIERAHVLIDSVHSEIYDNVGYIKLDTFSALTASQVKEAIDSFSDKVTSLVIDVRDNTGGYLTSASDISDLFVEKGKNIYQIKSRDEIVSTYKADNGVYRKFDKIAVLINGNSASASEILALALKESANAKIVGVKSFGKGTVQETKILDSGAMVKYTTSYWLSPNGNSINKEGITPDIVIEDEAKQLDEAIKAVK